MVAEGLFIFASTAVRLVAESMNPLQKFEDLVRDSRSHEGFGLYRLYSTVLRDCGIPWNDPKWRSNFINVLGLILLGKTFFSVADIDGLLGLPPGESSDLVLSRLKCLLDYSRTGPIRLLHTSFSDYLLSPACPTPCPTHPESDHREIYGREISPDCVHGSWLIDGAAQQVAIAGRCFSIMEKLLRFNICSLKTSYECNDCNLGLQPRIEKSIRFHLNYACTFWAQHLSEVLNNSGSDSPLFHGLRGFLYDRLLYWLEALSLMKKVKIAGPALLAAIKWTAVSLINCPTISRANSFFRVMTRKSPHF